MSQPLSTAMKTGKDLQAEMTQWENRRDFVKNEHDNLKLAKETLQKEIDQKTADYTLMMSSRSSELNKRAEDVAKDKSKLEESKLEFMNILKEFQRDKSGHEEAKKSLEIEKKKLDERRSRIDEFVIAFQRAYSLIG